MRRSPMSLVVSGGVGLAILAGSPAAPSPTWAAPKSKTVLSPAWSRLGHGKPSTDPRVIWALKLDERGERLRKVGMGITLGGASVAVLGVTVLIASLATGPSCDLGCADVLASTSLAIIGGAAALLVGTPIWITGAVYKAKARAVLEKMETARSADPYPDRRLATSPLFGRTRPVVFSWRFRF